MQAPGQGNFHFAKDWGLYRGDLRGNAPHRHYAVQLTLALDAPFQLDQACRMDLLDWALTPSLMLHRLKGQEILILLLHPAHAAGRFLSRIAPRELGKVLDPLNLQKIWKENAPWEERIARTSEWMESLNRGGNPEDPRIEAALGYLDQHFERVVPLEELAAEVALSPGRFRHLFRQETGITFRRAQLWNKVSRSFQSLGQESLTETAHRYGFTDSAHYSRTFKENFGYSPSAFLQQ